MSDLDAAVRNAFDAMKADLIALANETAGEARDKLLDLAHLAEDALLAVVAQTMSEAQAREAKDNLVLAARTALVNQGYATQARVLESLSAALTTVLKLGFALV